SVGAAVCCGGAAGLIVQSRDKRHFTAAVYNPNENKIFFKRGRSEHVFAFDFWDRKEEAVETACLGDEVKMSAEINGKNVTFAVESISGSASTQITVEDADGGGWGIIAFPGFGQSIFSNIKINGNNYGGDWDIYRNHWNRPDRPAAAYRLAGIGWHASNNPENAYFDDVARFKKDCEKMGYSAGFYSCNEIYAAATYPPGPQENNQFRMTDIGEAKYLVGAMAAYGAVNIMSGPCHISFTGYPHPQATCRTTVPAQIAVPSQPKPSHYGIRNIANIMDGFYQATFETEISDSKNLLSLPVLNPDTGEKMLLLMLESPYGNYQSETLLERTVDVIFKNATAKNVTGLDAFNGTAQELTFAAGADTIVKNVVVKDYPIFIKIN
ncbi:MAG: hypothetical protein FWE82_09015, partial [Defluviitaleaceae bacterium]|nr:hypothetical protein [Defluviitaleaceae bacterium]